MVRTGQESAGISPDILTKKRPCLLGCALWIGMGSALSVGSATKSAQQRRTQATSCKQAAAGPESLRLFHTDRRMD